MAPPEGSFNGNVGIEQAGKQMKGLMEHYGPPLPERFRNSMKKFDDVAVPDVDMDSGVNSGIGALAYGSAIGQNMSLDNSWMMFRGGFISGAGGSMIQSGIDVGMDYLESMQHDPVTWQAMQLRKSHVYGMYSGKGQEVAGGYSTLVGRIKNMLGIKNKYNPVSIDTGYDGVAEKVNFLSNFWVTSPLPPGMELLPHTKKYRLNRPDDYIYINGQWYYKK